LSGHSKWATIKHKKGALWIGGQARNDFSRVCSKKFTMSAKAGGGDPMKSASGTAIAAAQAEEYCRPITSKARTQRSFWAHRATLPGVNYGKFYAGGLTVWWRACAGRNSFRQPQQYRPRNPATCWQETAANCRTQGRCVHVKKKGDITDRRNMRSLPKGRSIDGAGARCGRG